MLNLCDVCTVSQLVRIGCYVFLYPDRSVCRAGGCEVSLAMYEWFYITVEAAEICSSKDVSLCSNGIWTLYQTVKILNV